MNGWSVNDGRQFMFGMDLITLRQVKAEQAERELRRQMDGHPYLMNAELGPVLTKAMAGKRGEE